MNLSRQSEQALVNNVWMWMLTSILIYFFFKCTKEVHHYLVGFELLATLYT